MHRIFGWVSGNSAGEAADGSDSGGESYSSEEIIDDDDDEGADDIHGDDADEESKEHDDDLFSEEGGYNFPSEGSADENDGEDEEMDVREQNDSPRPEAAVDNVNNYDDLDQTAQPCHVAEVKSDHNDGGENESESAMQQQGETESLPLAEGAEDGTHDTVEAKVAGELDNLNLESKDAFDEKFPTTNHCREVRIDENHSGDEVVLVEKDEVDDSFPRARDFLADLDSDDVITLANQASDIVEGFNDDDDDGGGENYDDAKTVATHRTNGTRVQPVSAAFRSAMAQKEEAEQKIRHPHQSIFDILDRNFEELGDGSSRCGRKIGYNDVKLCFVSFVAVFSLPSEPIFVHDQLGGNVTCESPGSHGTNDDNGDFHSDANGGEDFSTKKNQKEVALQRVPLSVAFALWSKVLQQSHGSTEEHTNAHLSYIRSTLVLLGMLDLAAIDRDRNDGVTSSIGQTSGYSNRSIECLVVHDYIHQQYGEYLAWGDHEGAYRSIIEIESQRWNEAVMDESKQIGSNQYTLRMLPLNTMRANCMQETFDILNDMTFVRRRIRVLGASGAVKSHVSDMGELLGLLEKQTMNGDAIALEPIDEQEGLLGAYQQVLKYCLHETEELTKCHKDDDGNIKLGKNAMYKTADIGNALHLLGASLGVYGFFDEEMDYYKQALRLKKLAVNGDIEKSISASDTLHSMGFSLDNAGKSEEALECYDQALNIRYACLGEDDLRIAETQHNKGALLCEEDRAEEAMECLEEALHIREIHYGEQHESCADTMQWMGNLLRKHGDPSDALDYFKFALSIKQTRLGSDDIDVANTLFNTAVLLDDMEKYHLSLVAYKEALRIRKLVLGEKNQEVADTLFCMGNVATVIENQQEAHQFFKESIGIREDLLHDDDLNSNEVDDTLLFISNPTSPRPDLLPQYEKLNQCFEEALPLTKLIMGTNHPEVCDLLNRMGDVYTKLHDWDNAIGSFQGALRAKRADAPEGQDDMTVATLLRKKGEAHLYKKEFIRAKATFDSAMQIQKNISGADTMSVAYSTYCLGVAYYYLNDFSHAKLLFQECMRLQIKLTGENDACIVRSICWLGRQHEKLGEPAKALERYLSALQKCKQLSSRADYRVVVMLLHAIGKLYEDEKVDLQEMSLKCYNEEINLIHSKLHVELVQTTRMLAESHFSPGMLHKKRGETEKAIEHLEKALELTNQCSKTSIRIATITDHLGMLHASREEFAVAKKYYSSAYSLYEQSVGRDDLTTSDCAFRLGKVLEAMESDLALDFFKESLRVHRLNMAEDDSRTGEILLCMGRFFLQREAHQDAVKCFEESLGIRKRLLGECADVADTYHKLGQTYNGMSQDEKALIFYRESVRVNKKINDKDALYNVSLDMAKCAIRCSHFQLAIDSYNDCLQGTKSLDSKDSDTALVLKSMGEIQMNQLHNYSDAIKLLLDALEILRGVEDEDSGGNQNITNVLLLIARAYASANDYENSLDYYEEYTKMLESAADSEDLLADSLHAMGKIFATTGKHQDYELAIRKITDCLDIKKKIYGSDDDQVTDVVYTLASFYEKAGYHDKATEAHAKALRSFKMKQNKAGSVKVYHALARLKASKAAELNSLPERTAAIECYKEALKIRRQIMSLDDIELASILYEYANLLFVNNDHNAALPLLEEALRIQKTKNGLKDERVANILLRMAEVHVQQETYDLSLVYLEQVLFIQSSLDIDDDDDCIDLGSCHYLLGATYFAREDFQNAIASYLECMKRKQIKFGDSSLECATVYNDLGKAYGKVSESDKAIESLVHALRIRKTELGNNSLDYGNSVFNLARIHISTGKHDRALNCLTETIRVYELFPIETSEELVEVMELKGDTLFEVNDYEAAIAMFQECIDSLSLSDDDGSHGSHQTNGEGRTARMHYKMGNTFAKLAEYDDAIASYLEAIATFSQVLGKDDLHVGDVMYDVGLLIVSQGGDGTNEKALECFNEMVRIYRLHGKEKETKVAEVLIQKSALFADCSAYDEATSILDDAIEIYKELLGGDAVEIGKAMLLCGRIHGEQGNNDESMSAFDEALRIFQITLGEDDVNVSLALSNIGIIHARKHEYAEAVEKCKRALKVRVKRGEQGQDVADSVFNIGNILNDWGKEDEAYQFFQQALKLYIHLLGEEDASVANCQCKLGAIYWNRKDIDSSLDAFRHALRIREQEFEDDDDDMLASIYRGIGYCHYNKGEYDQALDNFAKYIRIQKMELGDDCIEMASPCESIGLIYQKKEKYEEAMHFHSKALLIYEKHHGRGSKKCASSDFQIAKVLLALHKYQECVACLRNHLEIFCEESDSNEEVAEVYHPLGLAQSKLGGYDEASTSLNKALEIRTKLFGTANLKVAETMLDLGKVKEELGDSEEAIALYDQAITIFDKLPNSDFRAIASAYSRLGALFEEKCDRDASLHSWKKALKIHSTNCGSDSIAVGEILYQIGKIYDQLGNFEKSQSCFSEAVKIFRSKAICNEMVGKMLGYIGKNYSRKKQYAKAVELSTESLRLQKEFAQAGDIAESLVDLGSILKAWGKSVQAIQFFEEALRTYEEAFGIDSLEVATCRHSIGILNKQLGESEAALSYFGEALQAYRMKEGDTSFHVADNLFQIGQIYDSFGNNEKSLKCFEECLKIRKEIFGDDHIDVLAAQRFVDKMKCQQ